MFLLLSYCHIDTVAGFKGEHVICDMCLEPVMGYAWKLASTLTNDVSNLCCTHYNKYKHMYSKHKSCSYIPGDEVEPKQTRYNVCHIALVNRRISTKL